MKAYTNLEQSRKLAEILPLESADMYYERTTEEPEFKIYVGGNIAIKMNLFSYRNGHVIPCWSLAALLEQFPYELCDDDGDSSYLQINKEDDVYQLVYADHYGDFENIETDRYEHFVDACYEMILKLNELKML